MDDGAAGRRHTMAMVAACVSMFAFKVGYSGFNAPFSELLLARACLSLGLPEYPDPVCSNSDAAGSIASDRSGYFNLANSIPGVVSVSFFAMLADVRGRKLTLVLCYIIVIIKKIVQDRSTICAWRGPLAVFIAPCVNVI